MKHVQTITIPSYLCGADDHLATDGAARLFQEAAWQHAKRMGLSFTEEDSAVFWVLQRLGIQTIRKPRWDEAVTITTWPSRLHRLFAMREFRVESERGEPLLNASSAWLIIDAERRRPVRPEGHLPVEFLEDETALDIPLGKTATIPEGERQAAIGSAVWHKVRPSDTDRNAHVNNARYVQWFADDASPVLNGSPAGVLSFISETSLSREFCVISGDDSLVAEIWTRPTDRGTGPVCACRYNRLPTAPASS